MTDLPDSAAPSAPAHVLTLTLNPALDIATRVGRVTAGPKLRCAAPQYDPGGGGLNVSRALRHLGGDSLALVGLGGATGERLAALIRDEGVAFLAILAPGETRLSLTVTEDATGQQFRFLLPGPEWDEDAQARVLSLLERTARPGGIAVISGSQPPGVAPDFPARLAGAMPQCRVVLDTSGAALDSALRDPVPGLAVLRMDGGEARRASGLALESHADAADFAQALARRGVARRVLIARGAEGNILATAEARMMVRTPAVPERSRVGAGDSFVAGFVLAMARGEGDAKALALGAAAAAAAVMTEATQLCRAEDVRRILPQVTRRDI